jgi:hypothetical protein
MAMIRTFGENFHLCQHEAVDEGSAPEGGNRSGNDAWRATEYSLHCGLVVPGICGRQVHDDQ